MDKSTVSTLRVVLADDSPAFRSALCQYLNTMKMVTVVGEAAHGVQALALVEQLTPDVLILDLSMPKMDGYEVLQRLQASGSPVKVIVLTGHSDAYFHRLTQLGAIACIEKAKGPLLLTQVLTGLVEVRSPQNTKTHYSPRNVIM